MRAEYEKAADLLAIELMPAVEGGSGEQLPDGPVVQYPGGGQPTALELTSAPTGISDRLAVGAPVIGEDPLLHEALGRLAIASPDQVVELGVRVRSGHLTRT
ncbi:MAG: hypothetical protein M9938_00805 [Solirubrobacterales bacterium]|nr:hypothetical protein [Solirubrobacterales bacterium]